MKKDLNLFVFDQSNTPQILWFFTSYLGKIFFTSQRLNRKKVSTLTMMCRKVYTSFCCLSFVPPIKQKTHLNMYQRWLDYKCCQSSAANFQYYTGVSDGLHTAKWTLTQQSFEFYKVDYSMGAGDSKHPISLNNLMCRCSSFLFVGFIALLWPILHPKLIAGTINAP